MKTLTTLIFVSILSACAANESGPEVPDGDEAAAVWAIGRCTHIEADGPHWGPNGRGDFGACHYRSKVYDCNSWRGACRQIDSCGGQTYSCN